MSMLEFHSRHRASEARMPSRWRSASGDVPVGSESRARASCSCSRLSDVPFSSRSASVKYSNSRPKPRENVSA